ncbi:MAG: hypothetical protein ACRDPM_13285 [Solirubrobacteraceae bacterium]
MADTDPLRMCITVDRAAIPVSGRVIAEPGSARQFTGWTELFAALQALIEADEQKRHASGIRSLPSVPPSTT